jgi:hypothetical protein
VIWWSRRLNASTLVGIRLHAGLGLDERLYVQYLVDVLLWELMAIGIVDDRIIILVRIDSAY